MQSCISVCSCIHVYWPAGNSRLIWLGLGQTRLLFTFKNWAFVNVPSFLWWKGMISAWQVVDALVTWAHWSGTLLHYLHCNHSLKITVRKGGVLANTICPRLLCLLIIGLYRKVLQSLTLPTLLSLCGHRCLNIGLWQQPFQPSCHGNLVLKHDLRLSTLKLCQ